MLLVHDHWLLVKHLLVLLVTMHVLKEVYVLLYLAFSVCDVWRLFHGYHSLLAVVVHEPHMILFCWVDKVGIVFCSLSFPSSLLLLYFFLWLFSLVLQRIVQMRIDVFILAPVRMTFAFFA